MTQSSRRHILRRLNVASSIRGKVTLILLTLTLMAGTAGFVTYKSFGRVSQEVGAMTNIALPQLTQSGALVDAATQTKDAMVKVVMADDLTKLQLAETATQTALSQLETAHSGMSTEVQSDLAKAVAKTGETLKSSIAARKTAFETSARVDEMIDDLQDLSSEFQGTLLEFADTAFFDITLQGEEAISVTEAALLDLVQNKFTILQSLLTIRTELNFLTGIALASETASDSALRSILTDLGASADNRVGTAFDDLRTVQGAPDIDEDVSRNLDLLASVIQPSRPRAASRQTDILRARQTSDAALSSAVDDVVFDLTIAADDATTTNRETIQNLLDNEVASITKLLDINSRLSAVQLAAMNVATSTSVETTRVDDQKLRAAAEALTSYRGFAEGRLDPLMDRLDAIAIAENGLAHYRMESLLADSVSDAATDETVLAVLDISAQAAALRSASQASIVERARFLSTDARSVQQNLMLIGWAGAALVMASLVLSHFLIAKPLLAISLTTERLATGNLRPVEGFNRTSDEVARIAQALKVFRDGLVEKADMGKAADKQRAIHEEEQRVAVSAIGKGLTQLAKGRLNYRITEDLTEGYVQL